MTPAHSREDYAYMARALELARRGMFSADPNPRVGCVIVRGGSIIAEGWHQRTGGDHAEILALAGTGEQARGADLYVTLEPCCHHGRTPPCVEALIGAGIGRVVAAMQDPNPSVGGQGVAALRAAGIDVSVGLQEGEARAMNAGFVRRMECGRPYIRAKLAASLDGRTSAANGESQWISGEASRHDVQWWRARSSAILTGIGTVLADDPSLNVRLPTVDTPWRQPRRAVLDSRLRMPATARMLQLEGETIVFTAAGLSGNESVADSRRREQLVAAGARLEPIGEREGRVDLAEVFARLASLEVNEVLVEAGRELNGALLRAGLVDELVVYLAPTLLGDRGRGMFDVPGLDGLGDRIGLRFVEQRRIGSDWRLILKHEA